jgi:hypothetical protein
VVSEVIVPIRGEDLAAVNAFCEEFRRIKPLPISQAHETVETAYQLGGKLSEVVYGSLLSLAVDMRVFAGADSGDLRFPDGRQLAVRGVQVESRMNYPFQLLYREGEIEPDFIALAVVAPDQTYAVAAGYLPWDEYLILARPVSGWDKHGDEKPLGVSRADLRPVEELYALAPRMPVIVDGTLVTQHALGCWCAVCRPSERAWTGRDRLDYMEGV